jgi:universal stress protein E
VKPEELREIREIAVATDLSDASIPVMHAAVKAARALNARLYILHVLEQDKLSHLQMAGVSEEEIAACQQRLRLDAEARLHEQLARTDYRTIQQGLKVEIVVGSPDHAIGAFVTANEVDLLVIGTHGRRGLEGLLLGNTAERILPSIHASLLAVKPDGFVSPYAKK